MPPGTVTRVNDTVADLVSRHPGRLYGLATVDACGGDASARELTRAVKDLGLRGVFVASSIRGAGTSREPAVEEVAQATGAWPSPC